ncbi:MAG: hypothetical protein Q7S06_02035 [Nanoarchaeota archaeon]|nr:hypothetical protein [Nanoarchaeota archaeon]
MKTRTKLGLTGLALLTLTSCGVVNLMKEQTFGYKTLVGKKGNVTLYSGGKTIANYPDAKILYSSSDSRTLWFRTKDDEEKYWQGDALFEPNKKD